VVVATWDQVPEIYGDLYWRNSWQVAQATTDDARRFVCKFYPSGGVMWSGYNTAGFNSEDPTNYLNTNARFIDGIFSMSGASNLPINSEPGTWCYEVRVGLW